jgi:hypothetical protein
MKNALSSWKTERETNQSNVIPSTGVSFTNVRRGKGQRIRKKYFDKLSPELRKELRATCNKGNKAKSKKPEAQSKEERKKPELQKELRATCNKGNKAKSKKPEAQIKEERRCNPIECG